ncbi:hypothetical protein RMATCC62417_18027 [Rhizopus microsporus]|nr:hypothetical protein RMATCC62417_18027 [Rhizopus microsporus]
MGKYSGDTRENHKGRLIHNWIQSNELINWNQWIAYGVPTSYSYSGHSIVDYFLSTINLTSPTLTVRDDLSLESTHKRLTFTFQMPSFTPNNIDPVSDSRKLRNIKKLRKEKTREAYQQVFKGHLNLILPPLSSLPLRKIDTQRHIERINTSLLGTLYKSLDIVYGKQETNLDTLREIQSLENCQNQCISQIFGGRPFTSTKVMLHLTNLPNMKDRISILQAQFLFRASFLQDDALLTKLLSYIQSQRISKWSQLSKSSLWTSISNEHLETMSHKNFIKKKTIPD